MAKKSITDKLEAHRLLIFNSKDAQVAPLLLTMGVDAAYINKGIALYNETMKLVEQQKKEHHERSMAYDKFYVERDEVEDNFERALKLVKALSRNDPNLQDRLLLQKIQSKAIEKWIGYTVDFYNRVLQEPDFLNKLKRFKLTSKQLQEEKAAIENLRLLRNEAIAEKGQAEEATRLRNDKLDELDDYAFELKAIAEIALEHHPQLLEKLGTRVRS